MRPAFLTASLDMPHWRMLWDPFVEIVSGHAKGLAKESNRRSGLHGQRGY